ncbi:hypothetical protein [Lysinibacillus sp. ZYM-1]|uniref:phosphoribosyltransferase-like protein n=1 Tax=Lysinibacillus sp. ZYM-1 TaxID=1681184 RepID=UPI0006CE8B56|nr:hypothetical protein [Lysinibacillus sp. ZYM-1]KPN94549.1 hypothetical protein AO843_23085 [Lysinibacillus sp. ZYM-1]
MVVKSVLEDIDFNDIIDTFIAKNEISNSEEDYVINFSNKVKEFLAQEELKDNPNVKKILLRMLDEYHYYSKTYIERVFKNFYNFLSPKINESRTIYSPISSEKDFSRINSSYFYLEKFIEINNLSNEQTINLSSLYLEVDNKFYKKKLSFLEQKNDGIVDTKKEISKIYNRLKFIDTVVFMDDFSGTGDTIKKFLKLCAEMVKEKQVIIFVVHITEKAKDVIEKAFIEHGYENARLIAENKSSSFFEKNLEFKEIREELFQFEKETLGSDEPLGYKGSETLVTFYRNCPNNTISSYWWNEHKQWRPLFPRKTKIVDFFGEKKIEEIYKRILYNINLIIPPELSKKYGIKDLLYLLYINEFPKDQEVFEIRRILGYNENQLLEQYSILLSKGWIDSENNLLVEGKKVLEELKLFKTSFSDLTKEKFLEKSEDSISFDDEYIPVKYL